MDRTKLWISLALAVLVPAAPVAAQSRSVLVLPWSAGDADPARLAAGAQAVAGALASDELAAISLDDARRAFEERGSSEPPSVTDSEVDQLLSLSRLAVRHLAHGDYPAAREALLQAQRLTERAAAELNREEVRARQVLDTCLFDVRAYVETDDPRAAPRAMECRRLVPRIAPSPYIHTPEVVVLLERVDRDVAAAPPGSLHLESSPSGCTVRLNGIDVGLTPFVSADLASGEYRVQVECATARGRVHPIRLGEGTRTVNVDVRFDAVVRTDTVLRLAYASARDADEQRLADAISIGTTVGVAEVWLVSSEPDNVVRIDRVAIASSSPLASVRASTLVGLAGALSQLALGRSEDRTGAQPIALERWSGGLELPSERAAVTRRPSSGWGRADWEVGIGISLGLAAIGGFATSLVLADDGARLGLASSAYALSDPRYVSSRSAWQSQREASWAVGLTAGALGALAVGFAMEEERSTPWWSWVVGGAGLAGVVTGAVLVGTATECGTGRAVQSCVSGSQRLDFGVSTIGMSMPFLAVPVVFLLREAAGGHLTPSAEVTAESAMLHLAGSW